MEQNKHVTNINTLALYKNIFPYIFLLFATILMAQEKNDPWDNPPRIQKPDDKKSKGTEQISFSIKTPEDSTSLPFNKKGNLFEGDYSPIPLINNVIYPLVFAPDNQYYPNRKVVLLPNGKWNATVYIGCPSNSDGELFQIYFISTINSEVSKNIAEVQKKGNSFDQIPEGTLVVGTRTIKFKK